MKKQINFPANFISEFTASYAIEDSVRNYLRANIANKAVCDGIEAAISLCQKREQQVFTLRYKEGMTLEEIAKASNLPVKRARGIFNALACRLRRPEFIYLICNKKFGKPKYEPKNIHSIYFSSRVFSALQKEGINSIGDVLALNEEGVNRIYGIGTCSAKEIFDEIERFKTNNESPSEALLKAPFLRLSDIANAKLIPDPECLLEEESLEIDLDSEKDVDIEGGNVTPSIPKPVFTVPKNKFTLIKADGSDIFVQTFATYEEAKQEMNKQYVSIFSEMTEKNCIGSFRFVDSYAALQPNGSHAYIWRIIET